jgi:hypothetical protein
MPATVLPTPTAVAAPLPTLPAVLSALPSFIVLKSDKNGCVRIIKWHIPLRFASDEFVIDLAGLRLVHHAGDGAADTDSSSRTTADFACGLERLAKLYRPEER